MEYLKSLFSIFIIIIFRKPANEFLLDEYAFITVTSPTVIAWQYYYSLWQYLLMEQVICLYGLRLCTTATAVMIRAPLKKRLKVLHI